MKNGSGNIGQLTGKAILIYLFPLLLLAFNSPASTDIPLSDNSPSIEQVSINDLSGILLEAPGLPEFDGTVPAAELFKCKHGESGSFIRFASHITEIILKSEKDAPGRKISQHSCTQSFYIRSTLPDSDVPLIS